MTVSADAAHVLRRAGFGGRPQEIANVGALDRNALVDAVMTLRERSTSVPVFITDPDPNLGDWERVQRMADWWLDRMIASDVTDTSTPSPIVERMTIFWHNHFATSAEKSGNAKALYAQNELFRHEGLGNFRTLCQQMAVQVAMLIYLDNESNTAGSPNQNFARELMELFMLGIGNYTEGDVVSAAAAWSGHGLDYDQNWQNPTYAFHPDEHDTETRTFLGKTAVWDGPDTIDWILDSEVTGPLAARFIVRKIWTWLAYPGPSSTVVDDLATLLRGGGWEIAPVVDAMFRRDEFWSSAARNGLVRTPVEYVVAAAKALGMTATQLGPQWELSEMGQQPFYPPNVSGWRVNDYWISTSALSARADFAANATWQLLGDSGVNPSFLADVTGEGVGDVFVPYADRKPTAEVIPATLALFSIVDPSPSTVSSLTAWHKEYRTPGNDEWPWGERLNLIQLVLLSPDFQLA